ncbi:MAG: aminotransferase class V-fold PLP-dependent enzyme [Chloroflexi bacterium]|nr:aminotransferase class V-fold PLP-dependent enzyme [Chloroflexota bacterium]
MSKQNRHHHVETQAVHMGNQVDPATGAVVPPIVLSTTFERQGDGSFPHGYIYTRSQNPNRQALEESLAALEGGARAMAFGSGQAATNAIFQSLKAGDHVIVPNEAYFGTPKLVREVYSHLGINASYVDMTNLAAVQAAVTPHTKVIWIETPSNPLLSITDIAAVSEFAHRAGALAVIDNTWASPLMQQPLALGADIVMHATTKYISGHTDALGGALIFARDDEFTARVNMVQTLGGAVPSPFDCWLIMRGIRTLPLRVRQQTSNAQRVAEFLADHSAVETVFYPGLASHPGHALAAQQMRGGFGGMLSFNVRGGADEAMAVAANLQLFTRATSLGGIESLIEHRASIEGPTSTTPQNLLRVSIGIEHVDDLINDLRHGLRAIH